MLEICVETSSGLEAAIAGGADRIELCSALAVGGLTPSIGLMRFAASSPVPVLAMIRPRCGNFCFTPDEAGQMKADIDAARDAGLSGVVLGASLPDGQLDCDMLQQLVAHAEGLDLTLHRVFDLVPDMDLALEMAVELGFSRILTSGGATSAIEGRAVLQRLADLAAGRLSVMAGAGINASNIDQLLGLPGLAEFHASGSIADDIDPRLLEFGFAPKGLRKTDQASVALLKAAMNTVANRPARL